MPKSPSSPDQALVYGGVPLERSDFTALSTDEGKSALEFGRYEFKYVVDQTTRAVLENAIQSYLTLDAYCARQSQKSYEVASIYFDDRNYSCYYDKINGMLNRRKFRIRSYDGGQLHFLEEKGRRNAFAYKIRQPVTETVYWQAIAVDWRELLAGNIEAHGRPAADFISAGMRTGLRPRLRVTYRRRAYVGHGGYRFRVTFDDLLRGDIPSDIARPARIAKDALPGRSIVEIKFEYQVPLRFIRQIEVLQLRRQSVSKYCLCAEAMGLVNMDEGNPRFAVWGKYGRGRRWA